MAVQQIISGEQGEAVEQMVVTPEMKPVTREERRVAVSVIVRVTERPEDLEALYHEYAGVLEDAGLSFEFIFAAPPWADSALAPVSLLAERGSDIRIMRAGQPMGEAFLLRAAAAQCQGAIVLSVPAYFRVVPSAVVDLVRQVERGADVAAAIRSPRRDGWVNRVQSRAFHFLLSHLVGSAFSDVACGVYAIRREALASIPLYGEFFRFLPLLAQREGYRVQEVAAAQHSLDRRVRVHGLGVYLRRLIDILGLFFLLRFTDKPLRFFGLVGSVLAVSGGGILFVLLVQRIGGQGIANRPLLLLASLLVVLGVQAIGLGLIGEIIVHVNATTRRTYRVARS
ncbi:MAG: hypothetical protein OEZ42_13850, partial [Gemmatimonadota bacterium]|nr:hypothetical protein [Gemmatimonadota bacterium]